MRGDIDPWNRRFRLRCIGIGFDLQMYGRIYNPRTGPYVLPGWRWLHEPQPILNQPIGLGFPHRVGRYRPRRPPVLSPVYWICRSMERFLIRGWDPVLPGWRWLHEPQPISYFVSASGVGVSTPCGAVSTGGTIVFVPDVLELQKYGRISHPGMGPYHHPFFPGSAGSCLLL